MAEERNTVLNVWNAFYAHMKQLQGTSGGGSSLILRKVAEGETTLDGHPIPYLAVKFSDVKPTGRVDGDKQKTAKIKLKLVSQVPTTDAGTAEVLAKIAQIDDKIEAFVKPAGVIGFEDNEWGLLFFHSVEHGNLISAESELVFSVTVARGAN